MKISVLIPTYNRAQFLRDAISSALNQDYKDIEVIVSDNASTDNTYNVVSEFFYDKRLKYYRHEKNIGMVENWKNTLYYLANGEWFLILSDDDYFIDNKYISQAVEFILKYDVVMVYAEGWIIDIVNNKKEYLKIPFNEIEDGKKIFLSRGTLNIQDFTLCNVIFNRQIAIKLNSFLNPYNLCCDSELFLKSCLLGKVGIIKKPVSVYRYHNRNLILTYHQNIDFVINNSEYYINSYEFAISNKIFSTKELYEWKKRMYFKGIRLSIKIIFKNKRYHLFLIYIFRIFKKHRLRIKDYFLFLFDSFKQLFLKKIIKIY